MKPIAGAGSHAQIEIDLCRRKHLSDNLNFPSIVTLNSGTSFSGL